MEANKLSSPSAVKVGQKLFIPGARVVLPVEPYVPLSSSEKKKLERSLDAADPPPPPLRALGSGGIRKSLPGGEGAGHHLAHPGR
jgi:LysM repeat protein